MLLTRRILLITAAIAPISVGVPAYGQSENDEETKIDVTFWDKPDADMPKGLGYGMGGDMSKATMGIDISKSEVPAGEVEFNAVNSSTDTEHEMVVAPLPADEMQLPYNADMERVDEDAANSIGEVSELDPGKKGSLKLHLKAGKYILYCNIPGHYAAGMWTVLTVT